jgi:hypothetical protein
MATLPPPSIKEFPDDSLEKKVYKMVHSLEENIPLGLFLWLKNIYK